jgi:hypothetical protein
MCYNISKYCREIQFNEPLYSVAFNNARGDLLIGLSDQIALVKVQDYLPHSYLADLLSEPSCWIDDEIEKSDDFDTSVDFWEFYRMTGDDDEMAAKWHVPISDQVKYNESEIEKMDSEIEKLEKIYANAKTNSNSFKNLKRNRMVEETFNPRFNFNTMNTISEESAFSKEAEVDRMMNTILESVEEDYIEGLSETFITQIESIPTDMKDTDEYRQNLIGAKKILLQSIAYKIQRLSKAEGSINAEEVKVSLYAMFFFCGVY